MKPRVAPTEQQPESFTFADMDKVNAIISRYPAGRQQSATMPLLDLAQRQMAEELGKQDRGPRGGWIPTAAMDEIARILEISKMKVYEVATFYSMYNLAPMGKHHVQVCTTTPCWLRGSGDIMKTCENHLHVHNGETSADGLFTVTEVECLGACVNAPMVQINDNYYEDLTPERMKEILDLLANGVEVPMGPQNGRTNSKAKENA